MGVQSQLDDRLYEAIVRIVRQAVAEGVRQALDELQARQRDRTRFLSIADASKVYAISRRQLRAYVKSGRLSAYSPGEGKLLIEINELEQFIRAHRVAAGDVDLEKLADETLMELNTK